MSEPNLLTPLRAATLAERLMTVAEWLTILEGATDEDRPSIEAAMDDAMRAAAVKVDDYVALWQQVEAQGKLLKAEGEAVMARRRALDRWGERMRANAFFALKESGSEFVKGSAHSLSIVSTPAALDIYDGAAIPRGFVDFEVLVEPNKPRIKAALTAGVDVPGARLVSGETVRKV